MIFGDFWKGKKVFLTGHTGFKGSWLALWLHSLGAEVTGFSKDIPTTPALFEQADISDIITDIRGDICNIEEVARIMVSASPEIVVHMAAQSLVRESYIDPVVTYQTNVMGTLNVLEAIRKTESVRAALMITTDKCYENREWSWGYRENEAMGGYDPYSSSKGCAEILVSSYRRSFFNPEQYGKNHRVALATARAGNVIGGGDWAKDRLIPDIIRAVLADETVKIRSPHAVRPWQHVLEPLSGYLTICRALYEKGTEHAEAWNFGPNDSDARPVKWIVDRLCSLWGEGAHYDLDSNEQPHEANYLKLDISKARQHLGWEPRWDLEQALVNIVEWVKEYLGEGDLRKMCLKQIAQFEHEA